jgi:hypothetical protein
MLSVFPASVIYEVEDVDGEPSGGAIGSPTVATTEVKEVDGGP